MIDDEDEDHASHKNIPECQEDEVARSVVSEMQPAVLSFWQTRMRDLAGPQSLPLVLTG